MTMETAPATLDRPAHRGTQCARADLRSRAAGRHPRRLQRGRSARARLCERSLPRSRPRGARRRNRQHLRALARKRARPRAHRHRLAHRRHSQRRPLRRMRGRARRPRSHPRSAATRIQTTPLYRARHLHGRRADPLRHRLPGQPHDGRRALARAGHRSARQGRPRPRRTAQRKPDLQARSNRLPCLADAFTSSSNCTSSRARCSSRKASTLASSRISPRRPACASSSRAKAATPAAS